MKEPSEARRGAGHFELVHRDDLQLVATVDNLCFVVWRGPTSESGEQRVEGAALDALSRFPGGSVVLSIVEESAPIPSTEERRGSAQSIERLAERGIVAFAGVVERHGFAAGVVRAVITSIALVSGQKCPFRAFASVPEGLAWLDSLLARARKPRLDLATCASHIAASRAGHDPAHAEAPHVSSPRARIRQQ